MQSIFQHNETTHAHQAAHTNTKTMEKALRKSKKKNTEKRSLLGWFFPRFSCCAFYRTF
jgi:polyribonucleotide nucleotidyltransferase